MNELHLNTNHNLKEIFNNLTDNTIIYLKDGVYRTNFVIKNNNIKIIGESLNTIIVSNKHANQVNKDLLTNVTFRTETIRVTGSNVSFHNITIKNDSGVGPGVGQGVALSLYGDNIYLEGVNLLGTHDTFFSGPLPLDLMERYKGMITFDFKHYNSPRHFFNKCRIDGTVDFIFGSGTCIFYNCEINALSKGYLLAPSTYKTNDIGLVLYNSTINNLSADPVYLARPWREFGYAAFINNNFIGNFEIERFEQWNKENYRLYEHPFIKSKLGKPLPNEDLVKINNLVEYFLSKFG